MPIMIVPWFITSTLIAVISVHYLSNIKYFKYIGIDVSVIVILCILLSLIEGYRSRKKDKKAIVEFNKGHTSKVIERDIPIRELNIPENYILIDRKTLKVENSKAMLQFKCYLKYNFLFNECSIKPLLAFKTWTNNYYYLIKKEELTIIKDYLRKEHPKYLLTSEL
ncbi:hypothetical protein [Clostridium akagii]|uniref:hypothetical protein n=1 Tax=Clostridium akagii TaxID=91623 RepID=UPI00047B78AF|nr:hypothetical protein [Clostridium akagii]